MNRILIVLIAAFFVLIQKNTAQYDPTKGCIVDANGECVPNTILTAVPFLRIAPDARGGAMGDAGIAMSPDPNSMHYNPANLVFAEDEMSLSATYTPWLRELNLNDVYLAYLSGYKKLDENQAIGVSLRFFSLGVINFTGPTGIDNGQGKPREWEMAVAYARRLGDNFSASLAAKYIYSNLASGQVVNGIEINSATSFAADFSLAYRKKTKMSNYNALWAWGLNISNIGSKVSYTENVTRDFIPTNLGIGTALTLDFDDYNSMTFTADFNKLLVPTPIYPTIIEEGIERPNPEYVDYRSKSLFQGITGSFTDAQGGLREELAEVQISMGVEYWYDKQFAARIGYFYENPLKGARQFLTVGFGVKYNVFGLNISYLVPTNNFRNPLDNTLRFGMIFDIAGFREMNAAQ
jgi:hypothetical protein